MNRIEEAQKELNKLFISFSQLEEEYREKRKGDIYYNTNKHLRIKIKRQAALLENFGNLILKEWVIRWQTRGLVAGDPSFNTGYLSYIFEEHITEEEITSLFEHIEINKKLVSLRLQKIIKTGIPRNQSQGK